MIVLKTTRELTLMREACRISAEALKVAGEAVRPGISTWEIDKIAHDYIISQGAEPNFLNLYGFPATACISINDEVIHGIPSKKRILKSGDIVSIDLGAKVNGYNGDNAAKCAVGNISDQAQRLIDVTRQSFFEGIRYARNGERLFSISATIQEYVEKNGFSIVRNYCGHGIGQSLHEDPEVPNYGTFGHGIRLSEGMTIAIEPMVNMGAAPTFTLKDGWTVKTKDGSLSCHYENTVLITDGEAELLTY